MILSKIINRYTADHSSLLKVITSIKLNNQTPIIDYANENQSDYLNNISIIKNTILKNPENTFALKFSSLGLNENINKTPENIIETAEDIVNIAVKNQSTVMIDAEQDSIQKIINNNTDTLIKKFNNDRPVIFKTYQMYRKDGLETFIDDLEKYKNIHLGIKLVRGAYFNTDSKKGVLFTDKSGTDASYNTAIKYFDKINNKKHHMVVASHNINSLKLLDNCTHENISIAHLLGFSDKLSQEFVNKNYKVYKYLPYGNYIDTFPYLIRRLYENYPMLLHLRL